VLYALVLSRVGERELSERRFGRGVD